jgi:hypothetical protein
MLVPLQREGVTEEKSCSLCAISIQPEVRPWRYRWRMQTLAGIFFALGANLILQAGPWNPGGFAPSDEHTSSNLLLTIP